MPNDSHERRFDSQEIDAALLAFEQWMVDTPNSNLTEFSKQTGLSREVLVQLKAILEIAGKFPRNASPQTEVSEVPTWIGPYRVLKFLGRGGMGNVWLAEQTTPIQRQVALKVIRAELLDEVTLARFERERKALEKLEHPNIARILDAGYEPLYLAMEFVVGVPLHDYCEQTECSIETRLKLFLQLCSAVEFAHQHGILHRDIKPSNILVCSLFEEPIVKLIDFGLARLTHPAFGELADIGITKEHNAVGSILWMSPEQTRGANREQIDQRTDIYSLGVVLYWLLTDTTPIQLDGSEALTPLELMQLFQTRTVQRPSLRVAKNRISKPHISSDTLTADTRKEASSEVVSPAIQNEDLDWVVLKALAFDPQERYQHVADLTDEIRRYLGAQPVLARPSRTARFINSLGVVTRKPLVFGSVSLIAFLGFLFVWQGWGTTRPKPQSPVSQTAPSPELIAMIAGMFGSPYQGEPIHDRDLAIQRLNNVKEKLDHFSPSEDVAESHLIVAKIQLSYGLSEDAITQCQAGMDVCEKLAEADQKRYFRLWKLKIILILNKQDYEGAQREYRNLTSQLQGVLGDSVAYQRFTEFFEFKFAERRLSAELLEQLTLYRRELHDKNEWGHDEETIALSLVLASQHQKFGNYRASATILQEDEPLFEKMYAPGSKIMLEFRLFKSLSIAEPNSVQISEARHIVDQTRELLGDSHEVLEQMNLGLCHFMIRGKDFAQASKLADEHLETLGLKPGNLPPNCLHWYRNRAGIFSEQEDHIAAAELLEEIGLQLEKELPARFDDWASFMYLSVQEWQFANEFDKAVELAGRAIAVGAKFKFPKGNTFFESLPAIRARGLMGQARFKEARECLEEYCRSIEQHDTNSALAETLRLLAEAHFGLAEYEQAKSVLLRRIKLGEKGEWSLEKESGSRLLLFNVHLELGEFQKACDLATEFLKKLEENPIYESAWRVNLAEALCRNSDFQAADQLHSRIIDENVSRDSIVWAQLDVIEGLICLNSKNIDEARPLFLSAETELKKITAPGLNVIGLKLRCKRDLERTESELRINELQ